jgi:hypothetical protein
MPQYAALIHNSDEDWSQPEYAEALKEYDEFGRIAAQAIRGGAALYPTATGRMIQTRDGEVVTTDGPFTETKEVITGFYLLEAADLDEAVKLAAQIPDARTGRVEVRPVIDFAAVRAADAGQ